MATIGRQPSYAQGVNLTGDLCNWCLCLVNDIPLRFVKQHQSEILHLVMYAVRRLDKYLCARTVKSFATMVTELLFYLICGNV